MQSVTQALNALVAPFCILLLMQTDYLRDHSTDKVQKRMFFNIALLCLSGILADFICMILERKQGMLISAVLYVAVVLRYLMQAATAAKTFELLDYVVNKNAVRSRRLDTGLNILMLLHLLVLLVNYFYGYYFQITADNSIQRGSAYYLNFIFIGLPVLFAVVDILLARKYIPGFLLTHLFAFGVPTILGALTDWLMGTHILWSCQTLILLFAYLFILRQDADRDPLTKLNNRRSLDEYLEELGRESKRDTYTFIMMDLNQFKRINDSYGHFEGDRVLKGFADVVNKSVRRVDFAARFGGDEFCVIAKGLTTPQRLIDRIQANLKTYNHVNNAAYAISFSYGTDVYLPGDERTPEEFLGHVDELLYQNKTPDEMQEES